jgi:hypothetical protein
MKMCKSLVLATMILATGMGAAALARDDGESCQRLGQIEMISIDAMKQKIDNLGYDVRRIETERNCFEVEIIDRGTGGGVKAMFSRANGELLWAKLTS